MERRHILRTQKKQAGRSRECAARPYTGEGSLRGASLRQPGGTEGRPALGVSLEPPRPKRLRGPGSERRADAWEPTFPHAPESARMTVKVSRGSQRPGLVSGDVSGKSIRPPPLPVWLQSFFRPSCVWRDPARDGPLLQAVGCWRVESKFRRPGP